MSTVVLNDVSRRYTGPTGPLPVLDRVCLELAPGETLAVTGPSGSGKSTLLNLIGALDRPDEGTIRVDDTDVHALEGPALAGYRARAVGFIFQDHNLLPQLTALENVLLPTLVRGTGVKDAAARARDLLDRVGLAERRDHFPARMSGGERQRVAVARALVTGAALLLCDEPTGSLDAATGDAVADLFASLAAEDGVTIIVVTHNLALADRFGRRLDLRQGTLIAA